MRTLGDSLDWECVCVCACVHVCVCLFMGEFVCKNMPLGKSFTDLGAEDGI